MSSTSHLTAKFEALQEKVHSLEMDLDMYASMSKELGEFECLDFLALTEFPNRRSNPARSIH